MLHPKQVYQALPRDKEMTKEMEIESPSHSADSRRSLFGFRGEGKTLDRPNSDSGTPPTGGTSPNLKPTTGMDDAPDTTIPTGAPRQSQLIANSPMATSPPNTLVKSTYSQTKSPASPIRSLGSGSSPTLPPRPNTYEFTTPRLSTSSSQIFERSVQEQFNSTNLLSSTPSTIPAHIQTENRIPAVLEASSIAITDETCGVDEVEIVMHSMHQPAVSVPAPHRTSSSSPVYDSSVHAYASDTAIDESACNSGDDLSSHEAGIGAAAAADKRRLSFISFTDMVQAEQAEQAEHEGVIASSGLANLSPPSRGSPSVVPVDQDVALSTINETLRRSPSPIRLGSSPPRHVNGNAQWGLSGRSIGAGSGSPPGTSVGDSLGMERGELTIETMRQALRKTGSGDMSGYSSARSITGLRSGMC